MTPGRWDTVLSMEIRRWVRPEFGRRDSVGFYRDHLLPRGVDLCMGLRPFRELRETTAAGLAGDVVEVGFGSGLNLPHYPPGVTHLHAVDPALVGRKLARKRLAACSFPVEFVGLEAERIDLPDDSMDAGLVTWTLCTIPDVAVALDELRRVLKPGAALHFVEHGRAADARVARWQDRLNPVQKLLCGGCHLNRRIDQLLRDAGFELADLETFYLKGPKVAAFTYQGRALNP